MAEKLGIPQISTGDLFRKNISDGTPLGLEAKRYLDAGDLVPSTLTNALVEDRIGSPTPPTASSSTATRARWSRPRRCTTCWKRNTKLDAVLEFRVSEDELFARLKDRGRADDTEEVIHNRMKVYRDETEPLLEYYSDDNLKTVDAVGALDEVFARALRRSAGVIGRVDDRPSGAAQPQGRRTAQRR